MIKLTDDPARVLRLSKFMHNRIHNALRNDGILTIRDLVQKTNSDLLRIPNFGRKGLIAITGQLYGESDGKLYLGMNVRKSAGQKTAAAVKVLGHRIGILECQMGSVRQTISDLVTIKDLLPAPRVAPSASVLRAITDLRARLDQLRQYVDYLERIIGNMQRQTSNGTGIENVDNSGSTGASEDRHQAAAARASS